MQQNERIELIKAAVELTKLTSSDNTSFKDVAFTFDNYLEILTLSMEKLLKLEAIGNVNENN
jgi:hypothetical protein